MEERRAKQSSLTYDGPAQSHCSQGQCILRVPKRMPASRSHLMSLLCHLTQPGRPPCLLVATLVLPACSCNQVILLKISWPVDTPQRVPDLFQKCDEADSVSLYRLNPIWCGGGGFGGKKPSLSYFCDSPEKINKQS